MSSRRFNILAFIISVFLIIILVAGLLMTPIGLMLSLLDPTLGVYASSEYGIIPGSDRLRVSGLSGDVRILFDEYGIPHVFASSEADAFYAVGYLHAWFRLWQMDIQRRLASGRLSEILGEDGVKSDIFMRIVGLRRSAENTVEWIKSNEPDVYRLLEAYSRGVNDAIHRLVESHRLPLMFKLLDYIPDEWTPVDSIVWAKYMAWSLTNFWEPLTYTYLRLKLGSSDTNLLWPVHPYYADNITVVPGDGEINGKRLSVDPSFLRHLNWLGGWATGIDFDNSLVREGLLTGLEEAFKVIDDPPRSLGSNDWAVAPSRSVDGVAMMSDDPHLSLNMPSVWFAVHIKAGDSLDVIGVTLPGIPFIIIGANRYISWGLTNTQIGVMDFYVEKLNPDNPVQYWYRGSWRSIEQVKEVIRVKGGEDRVIYVNITVHGPIINSKGLPISFRWTGNAGFNNDSRGVTREAIAIYRVNRARNLDEFMEALRYWDVPSQNFMYADIHGNIAVIEPGLFPLHRVRVPGGDVIYVVGSRSVLNGTGGYEWVGYIPYEYVPHAINPSRGFLAAPNQMSVGPYYPYFILGAWWDPGSRGHEIFRDLSSKDKFSYRDMMSFQADTTDWYAYMSLPILIDTIYSRSSGVYREALDLLRAWDYRMDKDEAAPLIWWAWFSMLNDQMFRDYLRTHGIDRRYYPSHDTTLWLIKNMRNSKWFQPDFETVVYQSFIDAIDVLRNKFGDDPSKWRWGDVHKLYLRHLSMLDPLSRGPYQEDGGDDVLMSAPIPWDLGILDNPSYVHTGPSWRIVAVMYPDGPKVYGVYPGGQSGNPVYEFYDNYIGMWLNYEYIELRFPVEPGDLSGSIGEIYLEAGG